MQHTTTLAMLLALLASAQCCIYPYGTRQEAAAAAGAQWDYNEQGYDWAVAKMSNGSEAFPQCSGNRQSPILLPSKPSGGAVQPEFATRASYGTLAPGATVLNNGHTIQVLLPADFESNVTIAVADTDGVAASALIAPKRVRAVPAQFHFHAHSEHTLGGAYYPMELHIVHFIPQSELSGCPTGGCPVVVGMMYELTDDEKAANPVLDDILAAAPMAEGAKANTSKALDLSKLLPSDRSYITYSGSLTTPPCTEGVLWHVLTSPMKITQPQLIKLMTIMGDTECSDSAASNNNTAASGRRLRYSWKEAAPMEDGCHKMTSGHNYRAPVPTNNRVIKAYSASI